MSSALAFEVRLPSTLLFCPCHVLIGGFLKIRGTFGGILVIMLLVLFPYNPNIVVSIFFSIVPI